MEGLIPLVVEFGSYLEGIETLPMNMMITRTQRKFGSYLEGIETRNTTVYHTPGGGYVWIVP